MPSSCCLSSGDLLSHHFVGFVKSQEGENEDGNEGELVVKFIDALPKVSWKYPYGRDAFHLHPISNIKSFAHINTVFRNIVVVLFTPKIVRKNAGCA